MLLADIIECVATAESHRRSMDENAMRYLLFFRQHMLRKGRVPDSRANITWREIVWAYHSGSQDILLDLISRQFSGRVRWEQARECGIIMWMTDQTALVGVLLFEEMLLLTVAYRKRNSKSLRAMNTRKHTRRTPLTAVSITSHFERRMS